MLAAVVLTVVAAVIVAVARAAIRLEPHTSRPRHHQDDETHRI